MVAFKHIQPEQRNITWITLGAPTRSLGKSHIRQIQKIGIINDSDLPK